MTTATPHKSSPTGRRFFLIFVAACIPGIFIGWFLIGPLANAGNAVQRFTDESGRNAATPVHRNARDGEGMNPPERPAPRAEIIERFLDEADAHGMYAVPTAVLGKMSPIKKGRLSPNMADLLALSPNEIEAVDQVFEETENRLNESELARVEIISASDEKVILRIPGDPEEADQIRDAFRNGFIEVLGDVDGELLLSAMDYGRSYDIHFNTFGAIDRHVTFAFEPRPDGGIGIEFMNESPFDQKMAHQGTTYFVNEDSPPTSAWHGFKTVFLPDFPISSTVGRSRYLLPVLPEEMRSTFEAFEKRSAEHRAQESGASDGNSPRPR